jgi:valyl-tRNA synthetase
MVPLAGLIDVSAERARLTKEIERKQQELSRIEAKLANENFVAKAPEAVVAKEKDKADEAAAALGALREQLASLAGLD